VDNNCSNSILSVRLFIDNASKKGRSNWTEEVEQAFWDEELEKKIIDKWFSYDRTGKM
jgi:hypothetical protein